MKEGEGEASHRHYEVVERRRKPTRKAAVPTPQAVEGTPENLEGTPENLGGGDSRKFRGYTPENLGGDNKINNNTPPVNTNVLTSPPSREEVAAYAREKGFADPEGFAEYYIDVQTENEWTTGKGKDKKPVSNWKLNVLAWRRYHRDQVFSSNPATTPRDSYVPLTDAELQNLMR